jgi:hypothetical protein
MVFSTVQPKRSPEEFFNKICQQRTFVNWEFQPSPDEPASTDTKSTPFGLARNMGGSHEASKLQFQVFKACIMRL